MPVVEDSLPLLVSVSSAIRFLFLGVTCFTVENTCVPELRVHF